MRPISSLARDRSGSSAVEFAISVPILVSMIWGIFQFGLVFAAAAGMQNALGAAARYATVWQAGTADHRPTDAQISAYITAYKFGVSNGTWATSCPDFCITTDTAAATKTIKVTYSQPLNFLFFNGPSVTLTRTKVVYMSV
jgi:Flp pilus assembly protein TadG